MSNLLLLRRRGMMMITQKKPDFPRFTSLADGSTVTMMKMGTASTRHIEYSVNGGQFTDYSFSTAVSLDNGDYVEFRQKRGYQTNGFYDSSSKRYYFSLSGSVSFSGDITRLLHIDGANTIGNNGFKRLFYGQSSLVGDFPLVNLEIIGTYGLQEMFSGCTNIESFHFATINDSASVFANCSNCKDFTIDAETPPTIGSSTIMGLPSNCIIYVPAGSVAAYQAATYWSARAAYIQAIPNI